MIDLDKYFKVAETINDKVSDFLLDSFGGQKNMIHKSDSHYSISEDLKSNEMYESYLKENTPEVALYTEEGERNLNNDLVWVVDPIEGTSNYRGGNPFFASQIALLYKDEPVIAIVNAPVLKQKFSAIKGRGSFLNGKPIKPTTLTDISKTLLEMSRGTKDSDKDWYVETMRKVIKKVRTVRSFGSTGLCLSYLAAGIVDIYVSSGSQPYDYLPGSLIVRESGAVTLNEDGDGWDYKDSLMLASNQKLATEMLKIIK